MNKRFSTLLGASLLLSSAFSVAVAENLPEAFASKKVYKLVRSAQSIDCLLYTSPSPRDRTRSRMPSSA